MLIPIAAVSDAEGETSSQASLFVFGPILSYRRYDPLCKSGGRRLLQATHGPINLPEARLPRSVTHALASRWSRCQQGWRDGTGLSTEVGRVLLL